MGGGSWSDDVPRATHQTSSGFKYSDDAAKTMTRKEVHRDLVIGDRRIICTNDDPVSIVIDGTGSMGDWAKTFRDKSIMFAGQIRCQKYLPDPAFSLAVIGDANPSMGGGNPDQWPIQISDFCVENEELKEMTKKLYLEGGGGGHAKESYDLAMYAYARRVQLEGQRKGFLFILGDEGFYPEVKAEHLKKHFKEGEPTTLKTIDVIKELREKYHVFVIHKFADNYGDSSDRAIQKQWKDAFGENFIYLHDPNGVVDVMLGCIALISGARNLDAYVDQDMVERKQTAERRSLIKATLGGIDWERQK